MADARPVPSGRLAVSAAARARATDQNPPTGSGGIRRAASRSAAEAWGKRAVVFGLAVWAASFAIGFQRSLLVLMLAGLVAAVAGLRRPVVGLLGVTILCTLDSVSRAYIFTGGLFRWNTFNYWLLIVMALSLPFLLRLNDGQTRILEAFIVVLAVGLLFSSDRRDGMQHLFNLATIFGLLVYFARGARDRHSWYWMAVLSGTLSGLGGLCFFLQQQSLPLINANAWSFLPLTGIFAVCLGFPAAQAMGGRRPITLVLLAAVNGAWVFLSGSRGSFLIACACLLVLVIQMRRTRGSVALVALALIVGMAVASQFSRKEAVAVHRLNKLFDKESSMASRTSGRSELALAGWRIFLGHPLGLGTGGFGDAWAGLENREGLSGWHEGAFVSAHSGWIKVMSENGLPGITLFAAFILSFGIVGWKRRRRGVFLLGVLVMLSLSVAFLADEFQPKGLWFLAAGVMTVLRRAAVPVRGREARRPRAFSPAGPVESFGAAARSPALMMERSRPR